MSTSHDRYAWLGLVARTESERPHEWPAVLNVVLNRAESGVFSNEVSRVIVEPLQFSGFNSTYGELDDKYAQALARYPVGQLEPAVACARWFVSIPRHLRPLPEGCLWFYSPRSMKPAGRSPGWAEGKHRLYVPGIDPWRFTFLSS